MSERYIRQHFSDIVRYASVIERRIEDDCTEEGVLLDNRRMLELAEKHQVPYVLIDDKYEIRIE